MPCVRSPEAKRRRNRRRELRARPGGFPREHRRDLARWLRDSAVNHAPALEVVALALGGVSYTAAFSAAQRNRAEVAAQVDAYIAAAGVGSQMASRVRRCLRAIPDHVPRDFVQRVKVKIVLALHAAGLTAAEIGRLPREHVRVESSTVWLWRSDWSELVLGPRDVNAFDLWLGYRGNGGGPFLSRPGGAAAVAAATVRKYLQQRA